MWRKFSGLSLIIGILLGVTFLLRWPLLTGSFWLDEAAQIAESSRPWSQQLMIVGDFQPPLLHLATWLTQQFSHAEWWLRLWGAVIPSLIASWAMFQLILIWWPKTTDAKSKIIWLGGLLATNSLWVFYSQELRPYSLAVMWTCLSWLWLVKILAGETRPKTWLFWSLSVLGGLYSTYLFPFVLISQGLFMSLQVLKKSSLRMNFFLACLGIILGFAPWVPSFLEQLSVGQQLRLDLPGWDQVVSTTQFKALPLAAGKFLFGVVNLELNLSYLLPAGVICLLGGWLIWQAWQSRASLSPQTRQAITILIWWALVPVLLAWIVSFKIPVIQPKRILFILPAIYSLLVILALEVKTHFKLKIGQFGLDPGLLMLSSLLIINIWGLSQYYLNPDYQREDWRGLQAEILAKYPVARTATVFSFPGPFAGWGWYNQNQIFSYNLGYLTNPGHPAAVDTLKGAAQKYDYLVIFDYLETLTDPQKEVKFALHNLGWREIGQLQKPAIGQVRVYAKPENLLGLINFKTDR